jgi:hypothetical protein
MELDLLSVKLPDFRYIHRGLQQLVITSNTASGECNLRQRWASLYNVDRARFGMCKV